jgi:phosphopantothenoylcysteine decarboxylase/phosphopantothenate--cysteine ligase
MILSLQSKTIVLGVTGGVAAYKACTLARELQRCGAQVQVVMTEAATHFVGVATFQALTGRPVMIDAWDRSIANGMAHIELTRGADLVLVAPASADFMGKLANGLADDLLSTLCLARACPLAIAPAMNVEMWNNPATQRNLRTLLGDGVQVWGPGRGEQACGENGDGRMWEPEALTEAVQAFFTPKLLQDRRVLITAGPTFEAIDPVRGLTNRSSGKMGYALARACAQSGARVTLVSGPVHCPTPQGVHRIDVESARQMQQAVHAVLDESSAKFDLFIAVAAVADWGIANRKEQKIKKAAASDSAPQIDLIENPDILAEVVQRADAPLCVGFAAESESLAANAHAKRARKGVPLLVANLGPQTFGRDTNELLVVDDQAGEVRMPMESKDALAAKLVQRFAQRLNQC